MSEKRTRSTVSTNDRLTEILQHNWKELLAIKANAASRMKSLHEQDQKLVAQYGDDAGLFFDVLAGDKILKDFEESTRRVASQLQAELSSILENAHSQLLQADSQPGTGN